MKKASTNGSTTLTTKYIIDPAMGLPSVLAETDSLGTVTAYYVYGLGLISKISGTAAYFYQYDGLGSTVAITDKTGAIKNKYAYGDFGESATNSTEVISNPFKYVGKFGVMADTSDLLYMRARYYIPSLGRFSSEDPIGLAGGVNLYFYTGNNPISRIDSLGFWYIDINVGSGWWGGGTGGITIGSEGIGTYGGGGIMNPGISGSITWSPQNQSSGWNVGGQFTAGLAGQYGYGFGDGGGQFWEIGIGWPLGISATAYYQELWKWPWKRLECK